MISPTIASDGSTAQDDVDDILAFLPEAVVGVLTDQSIAFFNASAEQMFGYGAGEVMGRPLDILLPEAFREHHRSLADGFRRSNAEARLMLSRREVAPGNHEQWTKGTYRRFRDATVLAVLATLSTALAVGAHFFA